jgi:hypothetical protein
MSSNKKLDKSVLFNLLKNFDLKAKQKITLVAVGGTAMTALDLKPEERTFVFSSKKI